MEQGDSDNLHNVLDNKQKMTVENPLSSEFIHERASARFEPDKADKLERSSSLLFGNSCSLLSTPQSSLVFPNSLFDYQHNFSNHYGASSSSVNQNSDDFDKILRQMPNGLHSDVDLPNASVGQKDKVSVDQAMLDLSFDQIFTSAFKEMKLGDRIASNPNCHISEQASCSRAFSPDGTRGKLIPRDGQQQIEANGSALEPVNARVFHPILQQQFYMDATSREPWYRHCSFKDEENYISQPQHLYIQQFQNQSLEHVRGGDRPSFENSVQPYPPTSFPYEPAQGNANHYDTANVVNRNYNSSDLGRCHCEYCRLSNSSLFTARRLEPSPAYDQCSNSGFPRRGNIFTGNFEDKYMYDSFDNAFRELRIAEKAPNGLVFQEGSHEEDNEMFVNLMDEFVGLMTNSFWTSLCQKMVKKCNEEQLTLLVEKISMSGVGLLKLCCNHLAYVHIYLVIRLV